MGGCALVNSRRYARNRPDDHGLGGANGYTVFTHDLDFGTILAITQAQKPSVIQVRTQDIMPQSLGDRMQQILSEYEPILEKGALVTVDKTRSRIHILPFH